MDSNGLLSIGKWVTDIPDYTFDGYQTNSPFFECVALRRVIFPDSFTGHVGDYAFSSVSGLTSVYTGGAISIGDSAFSYTGLQEVSLPFVVNISAGAFQGCYALDDLVLGPDLATVGD